MFGRQKIAVLVAEFLSTTVLSIVALSMVGRTNFPLFLALAMGASVALMGYLFGTHSNPVITVGLWTMRKVQTAEGLVRVAVQMLGGVAAWQLSQYLVNSELRNIAGDVFDWRILIAEALGAIVLGLGVAAAVSRGYDAARTALVTGVSLALGVLVGSMAANGILNPAVAVGVQSWSWAYAIGPVLGGIVGMSAYGLLFAERAVAVPVKVTKPVAQKKAAPRKRK